MGSFLNTGYSIRREVERRGPVRLRPRRHKRENDQLPSKIALDKRREVDMIRAGIAGLDREDELEYARS